jgi:hypothetical protein
MRSRDSTQDDYILRMIRQAADALRLLRHRLMGTSESPEGIRAGAEAAINMLLGPRAPMIERLDAASAARLVGHPDEVDLWADLMEVEADALERGGDAATAEQRRRRVFDLRAAVIAAWGPRVNG